MGDCTSNVAISFLKNVGIELTTTCPYTPEQNMVIEQLWRTTGESAIAILLTSFPSQIYLEVVRNTACSLYKLSSPGAHTATHPTSPYKLYYGMQPQVLHFKVFVSKCYPTWLDWPKGKHTLKADVEKIVGYQEQQLLGWMIYLPYHDMFIIMRGKIKTELVKSSENIEICQLCQIFIDYNASVRKNYRDHFQIGTVTQCRWSGLMITLLLCL